MTLAFRAATPDDRGAWAAFVASCPEGDILQSWAWGEAGSGEPGEHWSRFVVSDARGHVRAVAQVLDRATMFGRTILYVPHGPLWDRVGNDAAEVLSHLLLGLRAHARDRRGVVMKLDPRASTDPEATASLRQALLASGLRLASHDLQAPTTRTIDLTTGDDPVAGWSRDARAEARRAGREGTLVSIDREGDPVLLDQFHALLSETADRGSFRIRSRRFLAALSEPLVASNDWFLGLATHDGVPLAGAITPRTGERAFYLYAASTREPGLTVKRGPYAVMAALQRALRDAGTCSLDLWGVRERDDATVDPAWEGFSLFKRRFDGLPSRHPGTFDMVIDPAWDRLRTLRERLRDLRP